MKLAFSKQEIHDILLDGDVPRWLKDLFLQKLDLIEKFDKESESLKQSLGIKT